MNEQLERERPDIVERFRDASRNCGGLVDEIGRVRRRREAHRQDAIRMPVLRQRIAAELAVARTHGDNREFPLEWYECFEDQRRLAECGPRGVDVGRRLDPELPLAVIAEAARLEHGGITDVGQRALEFSLAVDGREGRRVETDLAKQGFLGEAVLRERERPRIRIDRRMFSEPLRGFCRNILEIERRDVDACGERLERGEIAPVSLQQRRDLACARIGHAVDDEKTHAERSTGKREHTGELTAAKDAYGRHGRRGSALSSTVRVCAAR